MIISISHWHLITVWAERRNQTDSCMAAYRFVVAVGGFTVSSSYLTTLANSLCYNQLTEKLWALSSPTLLPFCIKSSKSFLVRKQQPVMYPWHIQDQERNNKLSYGIKFPQVHGNSFCLSTYWGAANSCWFSKEINSHEGTWLSALEKKHQALADVSQHQHLHRAEQGRSFVPTESYQVTASTKDKKLPLPNEGTYRESLETQLSWGLDPIWAT